MYQEESPLYRHEIPAGILVPKMAASVIPRFQIPRFEGKGLHYKNRDDEFRHADSRMYIKIQFIPGNFVR